MIFSTVKFYPNGTVIATEPLFKNKEKSSRDKYFDELEAQYGLEGMAKEKDNGYRSMRRIRNKIKDYTLCNDFKWFCTLTFAKQNSSLKEVSKQVSRWLGKLKERSYKDLKYIVVFERHKKGGIHCHALFDDSVTEHMIYAKMRYSPKLQAQVKSFNYDRWKFGFSTCEEVVDKERVSSYIMKYITKDMVIEPNAKSYYCSRNLKVPGIMKNVEIDTDDIDEIFMNDFYIIGKMANNKETLKYI